MEQTRSQVDVRAELRGYPLSQKQEQLTHCDHVASIPRIHSPSSKQIPNPQWCVNNAPSQKKQKGEAGLRNSQLFLKSSALINQGPQGCQGDHMPGNILGILALVGARGALFFQKNSFIILIIVSLFLFKSSRNKEMTRRMKRKQWTFHTCITDLEPDVVLSTWHGIIRDRTSVLLLMLDEKMEV